MGNSFPHESLTVHSLLRITQELRYTQSRCYRYPPRPESGPGFPRGPPSGRGPPYHRVVVRSCILRGSYAGVVVPARCSRCSVVARCCDAVQTRRRRRRGKRTQQGRRRGEDGRRAGPADDHHRVPMRREMFSAHAGGAAVWRTRTGTGAGRRRDPKLY